MAIEVININTLPEDADPRGGSDMLLNESSASLVKSGFTKEEAIAASKNIVSFLQNKIAFTVMGGFGDISSIKEDKDTVQQPYPIVCIINGPGANGKDEFIEAVNKTCTVMNLSSIDRVKDVVNSMLDYSARFDNGQGYKERDNKTDKYRQFLHAVKMAWSEFNDGPNMDIYAEVKNTIYLHQNNAEQYDVIFLHIREDAEIEKMYKLITEDLCIPCVRLYIGGLVEASAYENECDKNVTSNCADVIITNTMGNLSMFYLQATMFAYLIMAANEKYGLRSTISTVTTPPSTIDTDQINQFATVMETPQESVTTAENSDIIIEINDNATKNTTEQKTETIVVDDKGTSTSTGVSSAEDDGDVSFLADLSNPGTSATI